MTATILIFGVDAMEPTLIGEWIESGDLPNLARLRRRSAHGAVLNPPRFFSGASWPNFYTGQVPARHDQYLRTLYDPKTCLHEPLRPRTDRADAFWLSDEWRTRTTAVVCLPYCPNDARLNGEYFADPHSHDRDHKGPSVAEDESGSDLPVANCYTVEPTAAGLGDFRDRLLQRIRHKGEVACRTLASQPWALFAAGIDEAHCGGHQLWHLHDSTHPRHVPELTAAFGDPIKDLYVEIDRTFGRLLDLVDSNTRVLFVSTHGMGPAFDGNAILDEVLRRIEGLAPGVPKDLQTQLRRMVRWRQVFDRMPRPLRSLLEPFRRRYGRTAFRDRRTADAKVRRSFWLPTHDLHGGIRINLAGRENPGLVQPGQEYEGFVADLTHELHELRDVDTGEPVVGEVVRAADVDPQGYAGERPDLIVHWRKASFGAIESPRIGRIESALVYGRTGDHPPEMRGVFFAAGPRIAPGPLSNPVRLEDFAPTVSRWAGIELKDTAGSVIADLCASPNGCDSSF